MSISEAIREYRRDLGEQVMDREPPKSAMIMEDIKPYTAVAGDMAGKEISGRKQHREFLRRNGFEEVGNEKKEFMKYKGMDPYNPFIRGD
jgi:hypothetical protein